MINTVILTGRLTDFPELKTTTSGISVTAFSIAVERPHKSGEEKQTDFINIVAWRGTAEFIKRHFQKGDLIGLEGSLQTRKYQDKNGNNRIIYEVIADKVHFLLPKSTADNRSNDNQNNVSENTQNASQGNIDDFSGIDISDEDLPF